MAPVEVASVQQLAVSGNHLYASRGFVGSGQQYGPELLYSSDAGSTWQPIYTGWPMMLGCSNIGNLTVSPVSPSLLLATCDQDTVIRSTDGGQTWSNVLSGPVDTIRFHPAASTYVTLGTRMQSTDGGLTWKTTNVQNTGLVSSVSTDYWVDYIPTSPINTRVSEDRGTSWRTVVLPGLPDRGDERCTNAWLWRRVVVASSGTLGLVGTHYCGQLPSSTAYLYALFVSTDRGGTWESRLEVESSSSPDWVSASEWFFADASDETIYAAASTGNALLVSTDGGRTWSHRTSPQSISRRDVQMNPSDSGSLVIGNTSQTRYVTYDYGSTWKAIGQSVRLTTSGSTNYLHGPQRVGLQHTTDFFRTISSVPAAGLTWTTGPIVHPHLEGPEIRTADGHVSVSNGATWEDSGVGGLRAAQSPADPMTWYFSLYKGDVWVSRDGAKSTAYAGTLPSMYAPTVFAPSHSDPNLVYAIGGASAAYVDGTGGVFRTDDAGASWHWASTGIVQVQQLADLLVHPTNDQVVFVAGMYGVHKSTDGGATWRLRNQGFKVELPFVTALASTSDGRTLFAATGGGAAYRSLDAGETWEWVNTGLANYQAFDVLVDPSDDNVVYLATFGGVYKSTDKGSSWTLASSGLYSPFVVSLAASPDGKHIFASTNDHGLYYGQPSSKTGASFPSVALERAPASAYQAE